MGMYDYLRMEWKCPICGKKLDGFQIKDAQALWEYIPGETPLEKAPARYRIENGKRVHYVEAMDVCDHNGDYNFYVILYIPVNDDMTLSTNENKYIVFYEDYGKYYGEEDENG